MGEGKNIEFSQKPNKSGSDIRKKQSTPKPMEQNAKKTCKRDDFFIFYSIRSLLFPNKSSGFEEKPLSLRKKLKTICKVHEHDKNNIS